MTQSRLSRLPFFAHPMFSGLFSMLLALVATSALAWAYGSWYEARLLREQRAGVVGRLVPYSTALTSAINDRVSLLEGLRAFVQGELESTDTIRTTELERFAKGLYAGSKGVRNFAISRGSVYCYVFPPEHNDGVLGLDLLRHPDATVRKDAQRALESAHVTISGPFALIQGGLGIVARRSVTNHGSVWGLVTVATDVAPIFNESGLTLPDAALDIAITNQDGRVIFGSDSVFTADPELLPVEMPEGRWTLAAVPLGGWEASIHEPLRFYYALASVISLLVGCLAFVLGNQRARLVHAVHSTTRNLRASESRYRGIVETASEGVWTVDHQGVTTFVNTRMAEMLRSTPQRMQGINVIDVIAPESRALMAATLLGDRQMAGEQLEVQLRRDDGSHLWVLLGKTALTDDETGACAGSLIMATDITARRDAEAQLRKSEAALAEAQNMAHLGSYQFSVDGTADHWSDETYSMFHRDPSLPPPTFEEYLLLIHPDDRAEVEGAMRRAIEKKIPFDLHFRILLEDASHRHVHGIGRPITCEPENVPGVFGTLMDITDRRHAEEEQKALQRERDHLLRQLQIQIERMPIGYILYDQHFEIAAMNPAAEQIFGFSKEELIGRSPYGTIIPPSAAKQVQTVEQLALSGIMIPHHTNDNVTKDGRTITCEWSNTPLTDEQGRLLGVLCMVQDVTARLSAERSLRESEERYRLLFECNPHPLWVYDRDTLRFLAVNDAAVQHYGYSPDEFLSMTLKDIRPPEDVPALLEDIARSPIGVDVSRTWRHRKKDGTIIDVEIISHSMRFGESHAELVLAMDITERKRAQEQVKTSLQEKEVLLKEIHHRVKNNMQVICSLLSLQAGYVKDPDDLALFNESQGRVRSMALLHEKLYRSASLSRVDFTDYLLDLGNGLLRSYMSENVALDIRAERTALGVDTAIPCGLIVTELVSNALKYAFPDRREGKIAISLTDRDGTYTLAVADNGIGLPADFDFQRSRTLGLQLVNALVEQLGGSIELRRNHGAEFVVTFTTEQQGSRTEEAAAPRKP